MSVEKYFTLENILKVLLAIAVGIMLYKIFFKKEEKYYNYKSPDGDESGYAYPMDYEEESQEMIDEYAAEDVPDYEDDEEDEVVEEEVVMDEEEEDVMDEEEEEVVVDEEEDDTLYDYEDTAGEPYDDSADQDDAEDDFEVPDEVYEEADAEDADAYEYLYADDVAEGLQENFVLYSNMVGVDTTYD